MGIMEFGQNLSTLVETSDRLKQIRKVSIHEGDCLLVQTANSIYTMRALGGDSFLISGGWFDRKGKSPMKVRINGCTWGGKVIKIDVVAACGLCLEFGNRVVTSPIQKIVLLSNGALN
jgi:hypothetical protein